MGVQRRFLVVVQANRLGQMLDRLTEDPLLEADVADVDPGERVGGLLHQNFLEGGERVVVLLMQHLRPAEQRFRLRLARRELERLGERLNRARMVAQRNQAPPFLDERGGADVIGMNHGPLTGELGGRRLLGIGGELLVLVDELADVVLELRQLAEHPVHLLEIRDDLALGGFAFRRARRPLEPARDRVVLLAQRGDLGIAHCAACNSIFSVELSNLFVFKTTIVRPFCTTSPAMYSAARPFTIPGGGVTACAATCSTSVTASTMTPILPPSNSRMTVRVSSRSGAAALSRLRKSTSGTAVP